MGHSNYMRELLERFGLTHLLQVAMVSLTVLSLSALGLTVSQSMVGNSTLSSSPAVTSKTLPGFDLDLVSQAQLFGSSDSPQLNTSNALPSTHLQWVLQGVFTGASPDTGSAIIVTGDQPAKLYKAQGSMPGGARLQEVYPDHVVIEYNGQQQSLRFPTLSAMALQRQAPSTKAPVKQTHLADNTTDNRREMVRQRLEMLRQRASSGQ